MTRFCGLSIYQNKMFLFHDFHYQHVMISRFLNAVNFHRNWSCIDVRRTVDFSMWECLGIHIGPPFLSLFRSPFHNMCVGAASLWLTILPDRIPWQIPKVPRSSLALVFSWASLLFWKWISTLAILSYNFLIHVSPIHSISPPWFGGAGEVQTGLGLRFCLKASPCLWDGPYEILIQYIQVLCASRNGSPSAPFYICWTSRKNQSWCWTR